VRLWPRKPRQQEQLVPEPPARPAALPKLAEGGEQLRKAFLERLERREQDEDR
jgi:hypothetical protein